MKCKTGSVRPRLHQESLLKLHAELLFPKSTLILAILLLPPLRLALCSHLDSHGFGSDFRLAVGLNRGSMVVDLMRCRICVQLIDCLTDSNGITPGESVRMCGCSLRLIQASHEFDDCGVLVLVLDQEVVYAS
jgi:hypothetical protein